MTKVFALLALVVAQSFAFAAASEFGNTELNEILANSKLSKKSGIIYTWSPHMVLSQKGVDPLVRYGKEHNLEIVIDRDPGSNDKLAKTILQRNHWPESYMSKLNAQSILAKGARVHYPSYVFFKNGEIVRLVPGYKSQAELDHLTERYLK